MRSLNPKPWTALAWYVHVRHLAQQRKESGLPHPWTSDPILNEWRFTCNRRMDDRTSRWLMANWYEHNHPKSLEMAALARWVNLPSALEHLPKPPKKAHQGGMERWMDDVYKQLSSLQTGGLPITSGAYMIKGEAGMAKADSIVNWWLRGLVVQDIRVDTDRMETAYHQILGKRGVGSFTAGQIVADLRWVLDGEWVDRMEWAPRGPGSIRGLNYLFGYEDRQRQQLTEVDFLTELRHIDKKLRTVEPSAMDNLELMDTQNILCEFSKYWGLKEFDKRPKRRYHVRDSV